MTLEKKAKVSLTDEQLAAREANRQKAAPYKERRIALGLSQKELTEKSGISNPTISLTQLHAVPGFQPVPQGFAGYLPKKILLS